MSKQKKIMIIKKNPNLKNSKKTEKIFKKRPKVCIKRKKK